MNETRTSAFAQGDHWWVKVSAKGHIDSLLMCSFEDMKITNNDDGTTAIEGWFTDLPAVYGFAIRLRDTLIFLYSLQVIRVEITKNDHNN